MTTKTRSQKQIIASIVSLGNSFKTQQERAQTLAMESLEFATREGNFACLIRLYEVMTRYHPRVASASFKPWLETHAGVVVKADGSMRQAKDRSWKAIDLKAAEADNIWTFKREAKVTNYDGVRKIIDQLTRESAGKVDPTKFGETKLVPDAVAAQILALLRATQQESETEQQTATVPVIATPTHNPVSVQAVG